MSEFNGRVAVVTGGGSGIGEACAKLFGARGGQVVVSDVSGDAAERVASEIGDAARSFVGDVSDPDSVEKMVQTAVDAFGGLHIAVNNAGIGGDQAPVGEYSIEGWRRVISINLDAVASSSAYEALEAIAGMHPIGRLGTSEEVAEVVAFLASDASAFVSGSYYTVDGGYTAQ